MTIKQHFRLLLTWFGSLYLLALGSSAQAAELSLSNSPLFLGTPIDPAVFFMMDDSGSMDWEILTRDYSYYTDYWSSSSTVGIVDSGYFLGFASSGTCTGRRNYAYIYEEGTNNDNVYNFCSYAELEEQPEAYVRDWRVKNSDMNIMYYDPSATYYPWSGFNNANFNNVRSNPEPGSAGYTEINDLVGFEYHVWVDNLGYDNDDSGGTVEGPNSVTAGANGKVDLWDSHVKYTVSNGTVTASTYTTSFAGVDGSPDCDLSDAQDSPPYVGCFGTVETTTTLNGGDEDAWGRTPNEIRQNVANWYEF
jgi:type IV pilus assembly protein PilY1